MTKDRRLGRGLAALLGTPLEEDDIVDGSVESPASTAASNASKPATVGSASSASATVAATTAKSPVTGAVPLNRSVPLNQPSTRSTDESAKTGSSTASSSTSVPTKPKKPKQPKRDETPNTETGESLQLSVYEIDNNPFQPRRKFNEEEIAALAESIREHKQLQPVLVRKVGDRYQLISGERRLRATIHAGLKTIRAEVREADDRLVAELAIVENLQRKDLDPIEKALSFRRYIDQHKCTQDDLAKRLKIDRSTIANLMRLMELPEKVQSWVQSGAITAGHARALLPLGDDQQQVTFAEQIRSEQWSVRETERRVSDKLAEEDGILPTGQGGGRKPKNAQIASIEQQLRLALGTKAEIKQSTKGRGKIVINFANANEFDRILSLISPQAQKRAA